MTIRQFATSWLAVAVVFALLTGSVSQLLAQSQTQSQAQTASELLQKGIYLQETVGDLDGAIKTFQQVTHIANESRAIGAQAEYRLGLCLQKKGKQAEANKVFQDLIANYPDQTEIVSKARAFVVSAPQFKLLPAPWKDGEVLELSVRKIPLGLVLIQHHSIVSSKTNPGHWLIQQDTISAVDFPRMRNLVEVDNETMKPISSTTTYPMLGSSQMIYQGSTAQLKRKDKDTIDFHLDGSVWDNQELWALLRRLPLAPGYKTTLSLLGWPGGLYKKEFEVTSTEDVTTPAGTFHCYRVEMKALDTTYFISTDASHYLVKTESPGLSTELEKISDVRSGPISYADEKYGFSLALPEGWRIYNFDSDSEQLGRATLEDPEFRASATLTVHLLENKSPTTSEGMRERIQKEIDNDKHTAAMNLKVRPDSWETRQIGGCPTVSWIADYTDPFGQKSTSYSVEIQSDQHRATFTSAIEAGSDIAELQKKFDPIVAGLTVK